MNVAVFTNKKHIAHNRPFATWYDGTPFCCGRGQRLDSAFIDMNLPKEVIVNIIIPSCCFAEGDNIFVLDEEQEKFIKSNINDIIRSL
jgi:hypothetical protein